MVMGVTHRDRRMTAAEFDNHCDVTALSAVTPTRIRLIPEWRKNVFRTRNCSRGRES